MMKTFAGMRSASAHFQVVGLQQSATLAVPVVLERKDYLLKGEHQRRMESDKGLDFTG